LAQRFESEGILPGSGRCPSCHGRIEWGQVIRGCYARKAEVEAKGKGRSNGKRRKGVPVSASEDSNGVLEDIIN
jgi:structure-specific endonuclease subunit SLX1